MKRLTATASHAWMSLVWLATYPGRGNTHEITVSTPILTYSVKRKREKRREEGEKRKEEEKEYL